MKNSQLHENQAEKFLDFRRKKSVMLYQIEKALLEKSYKVSDKAKILSNLLNISVRAVYDKIKEDKFSMQDMKILSEKLGVSFEISPPESNIASEPLDQYIAANPQNTGVQDSNKGTAEITLRLNLDSVPDAEIPDVLRKINELLKIVNDKK